MLFETVTWVGTGLKQPVGLVLDPLGAVYVSTKELTAETDTAKRAIGKVHPDLHLTDFAANLTNPQGLALRPDGALYLADGKAGRLLRFNAPPVPTLTTPAFTNQSPLTVTGTTEPKCARRALPQRRGHARHRDGGRDGRLHSPAHLGPQQREPLGGLRDRARGRWAHVAPR
ncbi:MAG: hypothetical protein A3E31_02715 [Candidatus Rokubacteria bacterium RIFCSPHIGHO2_12_FULL_73_22]|nr:MAG: hypothetical protein A3D33_19090 [Candidatus Rokubacteria bacterium RIFCSPHIGHO2_02_FULL_73_26]OGL00485.1 MAG: hypothetical protein A3E31_02715 [Candidatus Rokubacteria bacterium RIFCSPHIGHO2_12_FULL_73_22]